MMQRRNPKQQPGSASPFKRSVLGFASWFCVLVLASQASGDDFPGTNGSTGTDGAFVTWCWEKAGAKPAELTAHLNYMINTLTDLTFSEVSCSDDPGVDMKFNDNLGGTNYGLHTCVKPGGDFAWTASAADIECDSSRVQINPPKIATDCSNPSETRRANWCHESGHALGLGHENNCMQTGCFTVNTYSPHHLGHLAVY